MHLASFLNFSCVAIVGLSVLTSCSSDPEPEALPEVNAITPTSGFINTPVFISGTNFSTILSENEVTFNGIEAVVTDATVTQLTAAVPLSAATGPVAVTVKGREATGKPIFNVVSVSVLTTADVNTLTSATATGGGNVTSDGGSAVIVRGICWSAKPTPTVDDSKTIDGTGPGSFTSSITGLTEGLVYYARAYATNYAGIAYGDEVTFTALVIGQFYEGGHLGYLLQPQDTGYSAVEAHGLIVASKKFLPDAKWFYGPNKTIGTKTSLGSGRANTNLIMGNQGQAPANGFFYAAQYCYNMDIFEYNDWYLPSKDELDKLYINRDKLPWMTDGERNYYWTSSEQSTNEAWIQSFKTGVQSTYSKGGVVFASPVRSF
jgi:hypothetical protein